MAYDGWIEYNGTELVNLSRTAQLSSALGIDVVWIEEGSVEWIETALAGADYDDVTEAPWYDPGYPASAEFAGIIPLSIPALDDSTLESTPVEYITNGGRSGKPRSATLPIVASVVLVASTSRGAEYGKHWMDHVLRGSGSTMFCSGVDLRYFRFADPMGVTPGGPPIAHRRNVSQTRGATITRKRSGDCSAAWFSTFTLTANDPFEYSEPVTVLSGLGGTPTGPDVRDYGSGVFVETDCPVFDYSPLYDPLFPALVPPPAPPDYYPEGWDIAPGMTFDRFWVEVGALKPATLNVVPVLTVTTTVAARMVRVSVWSKASGPEVQCDPLFSAVLTYVPAGLQFVVDGEQSASYVWDGVSPSVRRADSLVYSPEANPVEWTSFNDPESLYVTLDVFSDSSGYEGDGEVRLALDLVQKSD